MTAFSVDGGYLMYKKMNSSGEYEQFAPGKDTPREGTLVGTVKMVTIIELTSGHICGHSGPGTWFTDHTNDYNIGGLHGSFVVLGTLD